MSHADYLNNEIVFKESDVGLLSNFVKKSKNVLIDNNFKSLLDFQNEFIDIKNADIPNSLNNILRPYQKQGYYWISYLSKHPNFNGILADDMGLGKTLQVLTLLVSVYTNNSMYRNFSNEIASVVPLPRNDSHCEELALKQSNSIKKPTLLILPSTLVFNWELEIKKFANELTYYIHSGIDRNKDINIFSEYNLIITTYSIVRRDVDLFNQQDWFYVILDESQAIKNT